MTDGLWIAQVTATALYWLTAATVVGLVAGSGYLCLRLLSFNARDRYSYLRVALPLIAILPLVPWTAGRTSARDLVAAAGFSRRHQALEDSIAVIVTGHSQDWLIQLLQAVTAVYLAGVLGLCAALALSCLRLRRLRAEARTAPVPAGGGPWPVLLHSRPVPPLVAGILRPAILLPQRVVEQLSSVQLEMVLAHERVHLRRNDPALMLFRRVLGVLLWPSYPVILLCRACDTEMELACDETLLSDRAGRITAREYGHMLLSVAECFSACPPPRMGGVYLHTSQISRRIRAMALYKVQSRTGWLLTLVAGAAGLSGWALARGDLNARAEALVPQVGDQWESVRVGTELSLTTADGRERESHFVMRVRVGTPFEVRLGDGFTVNAVVSPGKDSAMTVRYRLTRKDHEGAVPLNLETEPGATEEEILEWESGPLDLNRLRLKLTLEAA